MSADIFKDVRNGSTSHIKQFIEVNIGDVNMKNSHGLTPLHFAAEHDGNAKVVEVLASMGADVNAKTKESSGGLAPLHIAATYGNLEVAKILVSNGADVGGKENNGFTPLHIAAVSKNTSGGRSLEVAKFLVSKGVDINVKSTEGSYTPLGLAKQIGDTTMIQYLSSIGAR